MYTSQAKSSLEYVHTPVIAFEVRQRYGTYSSDDFACDVYITENKAYDVTFTFDSRDAKPEWTFQQVLARVLGIRRYLGFDVYRGQVRHMWKTNGLVEPVKTQCRRDTS